MRLAALLVIALCMGGPANAGDISVSAEDFAALAGTQWRGVLRYLDYGSATSREIPVAVMFGKPGRRKLTYRINYPGEEQYNQKETLTWSRSGDRLNGHKLVSRIEHPTGGLTLVNEHPGEDDDRPADIRMSYTFNADAMTIAKLVRFAGTDAFFERNAYVLEQIFPGKNDVEQ